MKVILISGGLHLLALFVLGGITIVKFVIPDDTQFDEPPAVKEEAPPPEQKVEIKPQAAQLNQSLQRLNMKSVGNIAVSAVDDLPSMEDSFTVSSGIGGFSGGSLLAGSSRGFDIGMSDVSVFGLKTKAERILFMIDADRKMLADDKGGLNSYRVIKEEITDMVGNLSTGTLFNVVMFDGRNTLMFKEQLVPAGTEVHKQLVDWISPINSSANNVGLEGNSKASKPDLKTLSNEVVYDSIGFSARRNNQDAYQTQFALEQNVDAVFIITGENKGFSEIRRRATESEEADWQKKSTAASYLEELALHEAEVPKMRNRVQNTLKKINEERRKSGKPPRVLRDKNWIYGQARELDLEWENPHPGMEPHYYHEPRTVERYFDDIVEELYEKNGSKKPSVNVILFLAGDEELSKKEEDNVDDYVDHFSGKYRIVRGLDEITSARSAADTTN